MGMSRDEARRSWQIYQGGVGDRIAPNLHKQPRRRAPRRATYRVWVLSTIVSRCRLRPAPEVSVWLLAKWSLFRTLGTHCFLTLCGLAVYVYARAPHNHKPTRHSDRVVVLLIPVTPQSPLHKTRTRATLVDVHHRRTDACHERSRRKLTRPLG